jgi:hypothetical protein
LIDVVASRAQQIEQQLFALVASCARDPLRFVEVMFPWGEGDLAGHAGPDEWQRDILGRIRDGLPIGQAIRIAVASGHGPGKSALVAWIVLWALSTVVDTRGVVTANTAGQLKTKTWPELAKWHRLCLCGFWFMRTATAIYSADPEHEDTWRIDCIPWSENNTEAFAGLHNQGKRIVVIFDEGSAIPDIIWETTEGALTDQVTEILWAVFGNPTRNVGRFRACFAGGQFHHRWSTRQVDSRTARMTNKAELAEWVRDYGEDSDFVRVRVKGEFPRAGTMQFIASDLIEAASSPQHEPEVTIYDPFVMGVDVARFGDDKTVIRFRRGLDARTLRAIKLRDLDSMQIAAKVAELYRAHRPDAIFLDGGGPGAGVVDRCRQLRIPVIEVQFGAAPDRDHLGLGDELYANKRAEMWGAMRQWLRGGMIDADPELKADLAAVEYGYTLRDGVDAIILEKKEHMRKRGLASPDDADALALTFAHPVGPSDHSASFLNVPPFESEYDPFSPPKIRR